MPAVARQAGRVGRAHYAFSTQMDGEQACQAPCPCQRRDDIQLRSGRLGGVGWLAIWRRASRTRREPERADEQGDAVFGAQGAEPAPLASQPTPPSRTRLWKRRTHLWKPRTRL